MKKIILATILTFSLVLITGCGNSNKEVTLNLDTIAETLNVLNDGEFSLPLVNTDEMESYESTLNYIYDFEYEDKFKLDTSLVDTDNTSIKYNEETKELLAIITPKEGSEDEVKKTMESFCSSLDNCSVTSFKDYIVYVSSNDNDKVIENVKNTATPIFNSMMELDNEMFESTTKINLDDVEEYVMSVPMMMTSSSSYIIIKPVEGSEETVKNLMEEYMESLETTWEMYLPDQYELVKNRLVEEYGDYLIYIISTDNELVINKIKGV